MVMRKE
jgi:kinesin family protein C1